jgi:hypothetical protein
VIVPPSFYTGAIRRLRGEQKDWTFVRW